MSYPFVTVLGAYAQQTVASVDNIEPIQATPEGPHGESTLVSLADAVPMNFRIGPPRHAYCYQKLCEGLYKCTKKRAWAPDAQKLFLLQNGGWWIVFDAPEQSCTVAEVLAVGKAVFRSQEAVLIEGWHTWATNDAASSATAIWNETGLSCLTTFL